MGMATRHCRPRRHHRSMDRRDLGRLGHHIVSRRVALGYRNRTDLADSLQFTVRTLADVEHGVRKASAGTYAMLENKLSWAPGSIDTILAGGEPKEVVVELRRTNPQPAVPHRHRRSLPRLHRGVVAGATAPHHRPPRQAPRHLGRLGRPGPTTRQARQRSVLFGPGRFGRRRTSPFRRSSSSHLSARAISRPGRRGHREGGRSRW